MSQPQPDQEKLQFKIGLSGTFWNKKPDFSICVNNEVVIKDTIQFKSVTYYEFEKTVTSDNPVSLEIKLTNKDETDTVLDHNQNIVKDMLLNIESIEIDNIEIEYLKWQESAFYPEDPSRPILKKCVNLGWNGSYRLEFYSPFYLWLLENM
jgi:uncharacterized protein involved in tolerance to divalent cations